ncbi:MAG: type II toxin-antitoxin system VapB family antitoxin [Terriglobales bacterium]
MAARPPSEHPIDQGRFFLQRKAKAVRPGRRRDASEARKRQVVQRLLQRARRLRELPTLDTRSAEEIIGYDENGIPA